ncbi:NADH dehydrogenase [ubiquinone] 1 beta subcomplex subunit 10-like [Liolophura sinensis]|uniref:NADH dehydrogenase [ubiquinone] 1 beta subcomplex subunit 10-like n=1 Tax=Liolophura sinensis TaxID=3198878 RepID=UPI0031584A6B
MGDDRPATRAEKYLSSVFKILDGPATFFREKIVEPCRGPKYYYYHRRFRRVPTIDTCEVGDVLCHFEADEQFKRDKKVDSKILTILRQRRQECEAYEGPDAPKKCQKFVKDLADAEENWFIKYGDLGVSATVTDAYMKQKHRLIWERRHGKDKMRSAHLT